MKALSYLVLLIISHVCNAEEMRLYFQETDKLISASQYEEALERTIWFHNHALEYDPNMYGVRLSFALNTWHELGKLYPPALASLKKTRDNKTNLLLSGDGTRNLFHDVYAINRTLSERESTIELFKKLDKEHPALAKQCWRIVEDDIIQQNVYYLINKYISDLLKAYSRTEDELKLMIKMHTQSGDEDNDTFISIYKNRFVEKTQQLINISVMREDNATADKIKTKANIIANEYKINNVAF